MQDFPSITRLKDFVGRRVEIIAFNISYRGALTEVDEDRGTVKIVDGEDFVILEMERIDAFYLIE